MDELKRAALLQLKHELNCTKLSVDKALSQNPRPKLRREKLDPTIALSKIDSLHAP
jgi:hypothetical protein